MNVNAIDTGPSPKALIPPRPCYGTAWDSNNLPLRVVRDKNGKDAVSMDGAWRTLVVGTLVVWEY